MMTRARLIILIVLFVAVAAAFAAFTLLPRRYLVAEQLSGVAVFWHEDEAFVFVSRHAMARSTNAVLEGLTQSGSWAALAAMFGQWRPLGSSTSAYHLAGGALEHYELPRTVMTLAWDLEDGRLVARGRWPPDEAQRFGWTGRGFARLPPEGAMPTPRPRARTLGADDQDEDVDRGGLDPIPPDARERLKRAGWHFKHLSGYEGVQGPVALPITLRSESCTLSLRSEKQEDFLFPLNTTLQLTGDRQPPTSRVLFAGGGWSEIPRAEFDARSAASPGTPRVSSFPTTALVLLLVWLGFLVLKVGGAAGGLLPFLGLRRRLVNSVATTMSFPPAIPAQFPKLDRTRLEAFSRDLEGLGFERLLDTAPVGDSPTHPPTFCRVYAHHRHGCFGVITQSFPAIGGPIDLRCMIHSDLDEGWSVGLGNGQPLPASALVRRPRAIGMALPGAAPAEVLARFLRFRDQVSVDLGLRPVGDTSLETYIRQTQESLVEIREAMKKRSMAVGLGQYLFRKLARGRPKSHRVWLGDYPKVAEERKAAGRGPGFSGTAILE